MSICDFKIGEKIKCIRPHETVVHILTFGKLYQVVGEVYDSQIECIPIICDDGQRRNMFVNRFVRVTQKEFTDEEYESLLV